MESVKKNDSASAAAAKPAPSKPAAFKAFTWNGLVIFKLSDIFDAAYDCKLSPEAYKIIENHIKTAYYMKPGKIPDKPGYQLTRTYLRDQLIPSNIDHVCTYETGLRVLQALRSVKIVGGGSHLITKEIYERVEALMRQQTTERSEQDGSGSPCDVVMLADSGPFPNPPADWSGALLKRDAEESGAEANKKPKIASVACFDAYSKAMTSYIEAHTKHVEAVKYLRASPVTIDAGIIDGVRERFVSTTQPMMSDVMQYRNPT
jgi:hypothetical protein